MKKITVSYVPVKRYSRPFIRLRGKWLQALGFRIGDQLQVEAKRDLPCIWLLEQV